MKQKFGKLLLVGVFSAGVVASGGVAASALIGVSADKATIAELAQPGPREQQAGESVNDNKDDKDAGNLDTAQQGQAGDQQSGESVNDNKDQKDAGNLDTAQQGQAG
jgi:hypothetical protein